MQSGGNFDIDYEVKGPLGDVRVSGHKERQGDYVFAAQQTGEFSFCFSNIMSTFTEKLIDFDITIEHELIADAPPAKGAKDHAKMATGHLETTLDRLGACF